MIELKSSGWISSDILNNDDKNKLEESFKQSEIKENQASLRIVESDKNKRTSMFSSKVKVGGVEIIVKSKSKVNQIVRNCEMQGFSIVKTFAFDATKVIREQD